MSKYEMKNFQKKAYDDYLATLRLVDYRESIRSFAENPIDPDVALEASGKGTKSFRIQLDAPTGSGKTVMVGHFIKDFHNDYVVLVFSPGAGNLQEQTAKRLAGVIGEARVCLVDDSTFSQELSTGIAYVGNWEKFVTRDKTTGGYKNRIVREGDNRGFFDALAEVGAKGIPVLVLIDEAHHGKGSTVGSIRTFLNDIKDILGYSPLYLEISATQIMEGAVHSIKVPISAVQKEQLIRKNVRLNGMGLIESVNKLSNEQRASQQIEPFLVDHAINLQKDIDAKYIEKDAHATINNEKVYYHSLIGLQIPNGPLGNAALERTEAYLRDKHGISRENNKLFVYLSDDSDKILKKDILDNISSADSPVKVLIYKQGVATGWDCPRAQILLGFRHITSKIFTKQNLGRFVRTTQQKHYEDDLLDYTFVISNVGDLGQASFGDDVDTNFTYEKESVLRLGEGGHIAMSSFNSLSLEKSHYVMANQTRVPPESLKSKWASSAAKNELWASLKYSNTSALSDNRIISGELSMKELEEGHSFKATAASSSLAADNDKQYRDYETLVYNAITANGRNYGANAQIARTLARIIIRWYREMVWDQPDANINHLGKRKDILDIIEAEIKDGIRHGVIDKNDFAVEQLSLDATHWKAVEKVINETLNTIPSAELMTDEQFRATGSSWAERALTSEGKFIISLTDPVWVPAVEENKVGIQGIGIIEKYAYHVVNDKSVSYREGGATLSAPEISFEKNAISTLSATSKNGKQLGFYMKSPENSNRSYRIGVESMDKTKVSDFYPDYLGEIYDSKSGGYEPFIIEVKSEADVKDADGKISSLLIAKAKALVDIASLQSLKAGVAYEKDMGESGREWVIITDVDSEGKITTTGFKEYMLG